MYVVTNRRIDKNSKGIKIFGDCPSEQGPLELRLVKIEKSGRSFKTELIEDELSKEVVSALAKKHDLNLDKSKKWYGSLKVACDVFARARAERRHVLLYVHGFNNDVSDILKTAFELEAKYRVIVIPFSWPANGGGAVSGAAAYLSDKKDARASVGALDRVVGKLHEFHSILTSKIVEEQKASARAKHKENYDAQRVLYAKLIAKKCPVTLNLMCHSMGNYLLKYALKSSDSGLNQLVFDNVSLISADTNNFEHEKWVERMPTKNRLYVVINESDDALSWSRIKPGQEQLARLGHYLRNLTARNAFYLNVTGAAWVKDEHSYFKGNPIANNAKLRKMFSALFEGDTAEEDMAYRADLNAYEIK